MDWSHFWSAVPLWATLGFFAAIAIFVVMLLAGFVVVVTPPLIDYIIRKMDGLKGLAGFLGWCVGVSLAISGAFWMGTAILITLLGWIFEGKPVSGNPSSQLASFAVGVFYAMLGIGLYWPLKGFSFSAPRAKPRKEVVAQKWAEVTRWGIQWLRGAAITIVIAVFLPAVVTPPAWLAWLTKQGVDDWAHLGTGVVVGMIWASVDYIWHKIRAKRDQAVAS